MTLHTYGQWWFTTWGYTTALPPNYTDLVAKSKIGADAIRAVYGGAAWVYGSSAQILYIASGGSEDWVNYSKVYTKLFFMILLYLKLFCRPMVLLVLSTLSA